MDHLDTLSQIAYRRALQVELGRSLRESYAPFTREQVPARVEELLRQLDEAESRAGCAGH